MIGLRHLGVIRVAKWVECFPGKNLFWELKFDFRTTVEYKVGSDNRDPEVKL